MIDNMQLPRIGEPLAFAKEVTDEWVDYHYATNPKSFLDDVDKDRWSSDEEPDNDEQQRRNKDKQAKDKSRRDFLYKQSWGTFRKMFNGFVWRADAELVTYCPAEVLTLADLKRDGAVAIGLSI